MQTGRPKYHQRCCRNQNVDRGATAQGPKDEARDPNPPPKKTTKKADAAAARSRHVTQISSSAPALASDRGKRGVFSVARPTKARNGPQSRIDQQENLSRSSSVSNFAAAAPDSTSSSASGNAVKSRSSKSAGKKHDSKNNNVGGPGESSPVSLDAELARMARENASLTLQLGEKSGQLEALSGQVARFRSLHEEAGIKLQQLNEENCALRNRLRDVAHSPLSDNEKQQLLFETRHHSSAPASIATNLLDDLAVGGDVTTCTTPDWDKHSSGNVSEISVACLQDKINQMQETHYSTNEELQATLQELTDLQRQLTELQQENAQLNDEKNLMFESLCRQTERLGDSRHEVDSLKHLLYTKDDCDQFESAAEREQKLVELLKSAQEEREALLLKHGQVSNDLEESRSGNVDRDSQIVQLSERVRTLESTLDAKHAEHRQLDQELAQAKDQSSGRHIEINRLKDLLDNARTKIGELEQDRALSDKSELDELLDNARKEKDTLESEVAHLKQQLAIGRNEIEKLKEQLSVLQEECKVLRNNARTTQSDLEYKVERLQLERSQLQEQLQHYQDLTNEMTVQLQCQSEDKRQLSAVLSEAQRNLNESESRIVELEDELGKVKRAKTEQEDEWDHFQKDLLTSVRVANDFKTEAQQDVQRLVIENKTSRDRIKQLEGQIEKLKVTEPTSLPIRPSSFQAVEDLATRRQTQKVALSRQNSRQSVKSLIETIENAGKSVVSRSNSNSSVNSMATTNNSACTTPSLVEESPLDWTTRDEEAKTPLKEQQQPNKLKDWTKSGAKDGKKDEGTYNSQMIQDFSRRNSYPDLSERKDPLNGLVKNGGSKRNALLKWCQNKTVGYRNIDITNFSSSWNDGLALCALLHTYLSDRIPYDSLTQHEKRRNFSLAFSAAESVGITTTLNINDMIQLERPDWQQVMSYVTAIYKHFET